jgi:hypothetical protein
MALTVVGKKAGPIGFGLLGIQPQPTLPDCQT